MYAATGGLQQGRRCRGLSVPVVSHAGHSLHQLTNQCGSHRSLDVPSGRQPTTLFSGSNGRQVTRPEYGTISIIIIKHVLIKVTLSCQRPCRGTAQSLTRKKEQAEALTAGGRRQTIVAV